VYTNVTFIMIIIVQHIARHLYVCGTVSMQCLEALSVDDMRLRSELTLLLNALACNKSLLELDIR